MRSYSSMKPGLDPARSASKTNMKAARDATIGIPMGICFMVQDDCDLKTDQGRAKLNTRERKKQLSRIQKCHLSNNVSTKSLY